MKKKLKPIAILFFGITIFSASCKKDSNSPNAVINFDNLPLAADTFWNGSDNTGGFHCGNAFFSNDYNVEYHSWSGFAYSNKHDETTKGFVNQYSVYALNDPGTNKFVIAYLFDSLNMVFTKPMTDCSLKVTNDTYTALSMRDGDEISKKFITGDWYKLSITCYDNNGLKTGTVEVNLAENTSIVNTWSKIDLSMFGTIKTISFRLSSTDNGDYGMNTPSYFCLDDIEENTVN